MKQPRDADQYPSSEPCAPSSTAVFRVVAIIVVYHPKHGLLDKLLASIQSQVDRVLIVNNGIATPEIGWLKGLVKSSGAEVLWPGCNRGVAGAHNLGIDWARRQGATHVLLLDQDSEPDRRMVLRLTQAMNALVAQGRPVAAVGPALVDPRTGDMAPFIRFGWLLNSHYRCGASGDRQGTIRTDFLISSGMLIPMISLDRLGDMWEALFIDNVDLEWCFRAVHTGFELYGVCDAIMLHTLGDRVWRYWLFGWRQIAIHSSGRLYYMMRNRVMLYRLPHSPRKWILQDIPRCLAKLVGFSLFVPPRLENVRMLARGVRHGLAYRGGSG